MVFYIEIYGLLENDYILHQIIWKIYSFFTIMTISERQIQFFCNGVRIKIYFFELCTVLYSSSVLC